MSVARVKGELFKILNGTGTDVIILKNIFVQKFGKNLAKFGVFAQRYS
jgi:hypothetical protein